MATENCPTLSHLLDADECVENLAGLGSVIYIGLKSDLAAPMTLTKNVYSTPTFKSGKGLFQIDLKDNSNGITGSSLGKRKGFKLSGNFVIDSFNKNSGELARAINNNDIFIIAPDGDEYQIMYDPTRKIVFDADGINGSTGNAPADDRINTLTPTLEPVLYQSLYVTIDDIEVLLDGYTA